VITPSLLRYEDQIEVRLPLTTLRVVLRNQLVVAGRRYPNVDVGWTMRRPRCDWRIGARVDPFTFTSCPSATNHLSVGHHQTVT
jgi:hypothetical protein